MLMQRRGGTTAEAVGKIVDLRRNGNGGLQCGEKRLPIQGIEPSTGQAFTLGRVVGEVS